MTKETKDYISWDFDDTLYDWKSQTLNTELLKIFNEQIDAGLNVCIVTLRSFEECHHVRYHFPDVRIFYTDGHDKVRYLKYHCPVNIIRHYDDRLDICRGLLGSKIIPVWVLGEKVKEDIEKLNIINFKEC
jgi:hypothetical protein